MEMLPLLRRAFADFTGPERRQMGEKVKHLRHQPTGRSPWRQLTRPTPRKSTRNERRGCCRSCAILGSK